MNIWRRRGEDDWEKNRRRRLGRRREGEDWEEGIGTEYRLEEEEEYKNGRRKIVGRVEGKENRRSEDRSEEYSIR